MRANSDLPSASAMRDKTPPREQVAARKTAAPERVKPLTLGDLLRQGVSEIEAECEWCRHGARVEIAPIAAREGAEAPFRNIARRLKCSVCGWNRVEAWPVRPGRPAKQSRPSPLPSLRECRSLLAAVPRPAGALAHQRHSAYMHALRRRWPELGADQALFIVRALIPDLP